MFSSHEKTISLKPLITFLALVAALVSGAYAAYAIGGISFFSETKAFFPQFSAPFSMIAFMSFFLCMFLPHRWTVLAPAVCAPGVILVLLVSIMLFVEGNWDYGWLLMGLSILFFGLFFGWVGCMIGERLLTFIGKRKNHG